MLANVTIRAVESIMVSITITIPKKIINITNIVFINFKFYFLREYLFFYKKQAVLANGKLNDKKIRLYYMMYYYESCYFGKYT